MLLVNILLRTEYQYYERRNIFEVLIFTSCEVEFTLYLHKKETP
jgi:hypothetical protein